MSLTDFTGRPNGNGQNGGIPGGNQGIQIPAMGNMSQSAMDISEFCDNMNEEQKMAPPAMFRDEVILSTIAVLIGYSKPNPLLIGPAGGGKTKIVEDIARRLANNDPTLPMTLRGWTIWKLPLTNLVAGTMLRGDMEERMNNILAYFKDKKNKAIMFIDEIHMLHSKDTTYTSIAQILKPPMARGEIRLIGATTTQESTNLSNDPAFTRRFTRINVEELTKSQTIEILKDMAPRLTQHYMNRVMIPQEMLSKCVDIACEISSAGSHRPDNALTLMDRTFAMALVDRIRTETTMTDPQMKQMLMNTPVTIQEKQLKQTAMKIATGGARKEPLSRTVLEESLKMIKGQDKAVNKVTKVLCMHDLGLFPKTKPLTIMFAGSSGTGKTETTKIIARAMTGLKPVILNMAEYASEDTINRLIGSPEGYVGSDSAHEKPLDCLLSNPYQVILLDEFEKACKGVQRLFMSAFDEGYITDNRNTTIDFSKAIVIATTNAAHKSVRHKIGIDTGQPQSMSTTAKELAEWFDMELINRFKYIITFKPISRDIYRNILEETYARSLAQIRLVTHNISLPDSIPDDEMDELVATTYVEDFGARPASKAIEEWIESMYDKQNNNQAAQLP